MKILLTGAGGYIGKSIFYKLKDKYEIYSISRNEVDLTNLSDVNFYFLNKYFDVIIHCASSGVINSKDLDWNIMDNNLKMYYNLLTNKKCFNKLINIGSGAEIYLSDTPYGLSKKVISNSILEKESFYNFRVFSIFDENELNTRFIKSNIIRYINKEPMEIYENKYMDFFYMKDLIKLIEFYINHSELPKQIDCVYQENFTLKNIIEFINTLSNYKVEIKNKGTSKENYISLNKNSNLNLDYIGLKQGIKEVYYNLKSVQL